MDISRKAKRAYEEDLPPSKRLKGRSPTSQPAHDKISRFLRLPRELRDIIYDFAIASELESGQAKAVDGKLLGVNLALLSPPAFLLVCKQVRDEALQPFIQQLCDEIWFVPLPFYHNDDMPMGTQKLLNDSEFRQLAMQPWLTKLDGLTTSQGVILAASLLAQEDAECTAYLILKTGASTPTIENSEGNGSYFTSRAFFSLHMSLIDNSSALLAGGGDKDSVVISRLWNEGDGLTIQLVMDLAVQWHTTRTALLKEEAHLHDLEEAASRFEQRLMHDRVEADEVEERFRALSQP